MKCPKCGSVVREGNSFCTSCGFRVRSAAAPNNTRPYRQPPQRPVERAPRPKVNWQHVIIGVLGAGVLLLGAYALFVKPSSDHSANQSAPVISQTTQQTVTAAPSQEATPTPTPKPDYLLPNSDVEYLTEADISGLSREELCFARNEVFARHGRMFNTPQIAAYFEGKDWYHPTIPAAQFDDSTLNAVEKANVQLISQYENSHYGGSYY